MRTPQGTYVMDTHVDGRPNGHVARGTQSSMHLGGTSHKRCLFCRHQAKQCLSRMHRFLVAGMATVRGWR